MHASGPFPLVDPEATRASCGTGFVAETSGVPSRRAVALAIGALKRLFHRGAKAADMTSGDGAGLLTDLPLAILDAALRPGETLAVAMIFTTPIEADAAERALRGACAEHGLRWLSLRRVPTEPGVLGELARACRPVVVQALVACPESPDPRPLESRLYLARRAAEKRLPRRTETTICSFSSRTIVYKGLMTSHQLDAFYPDLAREDYVSRFAIFHERFATNTVPSWAMAQPFRMLAHNGEINTIKGNRLWMRAREGRLESPFWGEALATLLPVLTERASDSRSLDEALEFLVRSGRDPLLAAMMLIPDPYAYDRTMEPALRDFFVYHENLIEPWDGPAAVVFTDGEVVAAKLDRNGLRPLRSMRTRDGLVVVASEAGVVDVPDEDLLAHHHLTSGEILAVDLRGGGLRESAAVKARVAASAPWSRLLERHLVRVERGAPAVEFAAGAAPDPRLPVAFGWTQDEVKGFLVPMAETGRESVGSMGDDTPPAFLSAKDRRLYDHFKQAFAQVTNPPIDPIRERFVTGLFRYLGSEDNLLGEAPEFHGAIHLEGPVLSPRELEALGSLPGFPVVGVRCLVERHAPLSERLESLCEEAQRACEAGARILVLSDEEADAEQLPVPMMLAVCAVHEHLVARRERSGVSIVAATGDLVEDHHVACLVAVGASAVYPWLAYGILRRHFAGAEDLPSKLENYRWALEKGLLKIMSKMGIATLSSYHGSMSLHALGLSPTLLAPYFPSIEGRAGGVGIAHLRAALLERAHRAWGTDAPSLADAGSFRFRRGGEAHGFAPARFKRIHALAAGRPAPAVENDPPVYLRDLLAIEGGAPVPLDAVEPAESILRRFGSGAISFGAISDESHRTLARGFHLVGARSSSGEGGEPADRYAPGNPDPSANCSVKQLASARFGVTTDYLAAAREIQIKMAQGAKPGEGGQLPGHKVTLQIAAARAATPGVPLISPPPHHDIYSIEDLAQLVHDLKAVNPRAVVSVKLVAQPGVGQIACGVAKAGADAILVSGGDGGTGASPLGSLKHTGFPWELGLPEAHQALVASGLRERVTLRVDGGLQNGRDVAIATLLGAEEYDFGTAALVAIGCVMARQCHLNTCPAGIATQDEALRRKFEGKPEQVAAWLRAVAGEVREALAAAGFRSLDAAVGRNDRLALDPRHDALVAERGVDLRALLEAGGGRGLPLGRPRLTGLPSERARTLDDDVIDEVRREIVTHGQAVVRRAIRNTDRSVGARLSGELAFLYGRGGYRGNLQLRLRGAAGQSFGAFLVEGVELRLRGVANDYVGKGMSGGLISVRMPREVRETGIAQTVLGNVALYGATGGTLLVAGRAGERFAVRNSGATAVVEGIGNHGCEYMTRGTVVVLGPAGTNFGAGMTGGVAYVLDPGGALASRVNPDFVRVLAPGPADEALLLRLIRQHVFHTGSPAGTALLDGWDAARDAFAKVVPVALDIVDFRAIHDASVESRLGVLLNE